MTQSLIFDPLIPWPVLWAAVGLAGLLLAFALWRGLGGWWLRGLAVSVVLIALANPALQEEDRAPLSDIVIAVVDESASQPDAVVPLPILRTGASLAGRQNRRMERTACILSSRRSRGERLMAGSMWRTVPQGVRRVVRSRHRLRTIEQDETMESTGPVACRSCRFSMGRSNQG